MNSLTPIDDGLWIAERRLRFVGLEVGTRMTVVRLAGGGLFVHSPVALDDATREAVDRLGPVAAIVAPCLYHHLFVGDWARAYPAASVSGCPGLAAKRSDVRWSRELGDGVPGDAEWRGDLEQVAFTALPLQNEVVFFHPATRTMITSDVVFDLARHPSAVTRAVAFMTGLRAPGPTLLERLFIRDRAAAKEQIGRMVAWGAERIVLAHGALVTTDAAAVLERAYRWL
ncbi:MAG: DUF4336 domain-containing protein [Labilithrix sp.]|nr:DUF4336 domain-containing protein [Labilithrix sp.]MCW5809755.1 DUF4336 domain-containing protein [Labilithrix sp.]